MANPLQNVKTFSELIDYLGNELDWPVDGIEFDELTFEFHPEELGIKAEEFASVKEIKQLRPLRSNQPWGIFFVEFESKKLPVVALRKILGGLVVKKRHSAEKGERAAWKMHDLLFISRYGAKNDRQIALANFTDGATERDLPTLKVLGWDELDTKLTLEHVHAVLKETLRWPDDPRQTGAWKEQWSGAFVRRHREIINTTELLVKRLAELAKKIRERAKSVLAIETDTGSLRKLFHSIQKTLIHDLDENGFADMYAQTVSYGLFSAAVARAMSIKAEPAVRSGDLVKAVPVTNPFLREMLTAFLTVGGRTQFLDFDELGIQEIVELLNSPRTDIGAVVRHFRDRRKEEDPVIHFYEDFLKQYDKRQKIQRGEFYTPYQVVSYIVRSVHELLRTEFGLEDGLADTATWGDMLAKRKDLKLPEGVGESDPFVTVLDPATGTATFLVEVIGVIHQTMTEKWKRGKKTESERKKAWNEYVPDHLLPRLYGYELKMAPYVIAHMTIDMKLKETGYDFSGDRQTNVFLTNTLEPPSDLADKDAADLFGALAEEARKVDEVKRNRRFAVVVGNPPYSGISMNKGKWITGLIEEYKYVDGVHFGERKHWLDDDYVKFIRFGQEAVNECGVGILAYITNHRFINNVTFRGMRWNLLRCFNKIDIIDLHGNTIDVVHDGDKDENVFDIKQGVSVNIFIKTNDKAKDASAEVRHCDFYGKRQEKYRLLADTTSSMVFAKIVPAASFYFFSLKDEAGREDYEKWLGVADLMPETVMGVTTARDFLVVDSDKNTLLERIGRFIDSSRSDDEIRSLFFPNKREKKYPAGDTRGWSLSKARETIKNFDHARIIKRILYRPFDVQYIYYSPEMVDWGRENLMSNFIGKDNWGLCLVRINRDDLCTVLITDQIVDKTVLSSKDNANVFPLYLYPDRTSLLGTDQTPNFDEKIVARIAEGIDLKFEPEKSGDPKKFSPLDLLDYIYAVLHSPTYRERYREFLKTDFPRVPYPPDDRLFRKLAKSGEKLRSLHLMEGVQPRNGLANYDIKGANAVEKIKYENENVWINESQYFSRVPPETWNFFIGGYQPAQKWLKDRRTRTLTAEDIDHYRKIVFVLSETIRLMAEIDSVINAHGGFPDAFANGAG